MAEYRIPQTVAIVHRPRSRGARLDAAAAVVAALVATSLLLAALFALSVLVYDESPWKLLRMGAAIAGGPALLAPEHAFDAGVVALGVTVHFAFAMLFALAFVGITAEAPRSILPVLGFAYGLALHFAIFHGASSALPWLAEMRTPDTALAFVAFGVVLARLYQVFAESSTQAR